MKLQMKKYNLIAFILVCFQIIGFGQMNRYEYNRPITGMTDNSQWQRIDLPADLYQKTNTSLSDIRIYQVMAANDTIEVPYVLDTEIKKTKSKNINFEILNQSKRTLGPSFTFRLDDKTTINEINLNFQNSNFDWKINLEGSENQKSWSTILEDYRILAIRTPNGEYRYTRLVFPQSNFEYYRVTIKTNDKVKFNKAVLNLEESSDIRYSELPIVSQTIETNPKEKESVIDIDLGEKYLVDQLRLEVNTIDDYYRPIDIQVLHDSSLINKKWNYHYRSVYRGTLSSLQESKFHFLGSLTNKLKIQIKNYDNPPLQLGKVNVKNRIRFVFLKPSSDANLYLCYGNSSARSPHYDLQYFKNKIKFDGQSMDLGQESYKPITKNRVNPLFSNKWWLYVLLFSLVAGLGLISLKMLKEK